MNWRIENTTDQNGGKRFLIIDEKETFICSLHDTSELENRIIVKAPDMFQAITEFIQEVNNGKLKPKTACKKFEELISKINP